MKEISDSQPNYAWDALMIGVIILGGMLSIYFSPFGIADRMDNYSQDLFNKFFGKYEVVYPADGQKQISVLLLTDETIDTQYAGVWPIPYSAHARILNNLLRHRPRAVIIDFLWLNQEKPGVAYLLKVLERYQRENIPVYLSCRSQDEFHNLWSELEGLVIPVSPKIAVDASDFVARNYPVKSKDLYSLAFKSYQDLFVPQFDTEDIPNLQIFWGLQANSQNAVWMDRGDSKDSGLDLLMDGFSAVKYSPPYTTTVLVRDLLNPTAESDDGAYSDLADHLYDRVVFYGGNIDGVSDLVYTPTRQIRPGVYYHAMALDNLISMQGGYKTKEIKQSVQDRWWWANDIFVHLIVLLFPSIIIYLRHKRKRGKQTFFGRKMPAFPAWLAVRITDSKFIKPIKFVLIIVIRSILARLPLFIWLLGSVIVCFKVLELTPSNWIGYFAFTELGFYLDNVLFFEESANKNWEAAHE